MDLIYSSTNTRRFLREGRPRKPRGGFDARGSSRGAPSPPLQRESSANVLWTRREPWKRWLEEVDSPGSLVFAMVSHLLDTAVATQSRKRGLVAMVFHVDPRVPMVPLGF